MSLAIKREKNVKFTLLFFSWSWFDETWKINIMNGFVMKFKWFNGWPLICWLGATMDVAGWTGTNQFILFCA